MKVKLNALARGAFVNKYAMKPKRVSQLEIYSPKKASENRLMIRIGFICLEKKGSIEDCLTRHKC